MFCKKCGSEINPGVKFCKTCGTPVNNESNVNYATGANYANKQGGSANYPNSNANSNRYDEQIENPTYYREDDTPKYDGPAYDYNATEYGVPASEYDRTVIYKKKGLGKAGVLSIVLGIIIAILIGAIVFVAISYSNDGELPFFGGGSSSNQSTNDDDEEKEKEEEKSKEKVLSLDVFEAPSVTDEFDCTVGGTASVEGCNAEVYVNGDYVKTIKDGSEEEKWEYNVKLDRGDNRIKIELYDPENKDETLKSEIIEIEKLKYLKGTTLYKTCEEGLRIRKSPSTTADKVLTLEYYEDYVPMVCLGEEHYGEGYTWCKVEVKGVVGWVGTDGNAEPIQ